MKVKELAELWIEYHHTDDDELFKSVTKLERMLETDEERAWRVILLILKIDCSDVIISNLAAGPMEEILVRHGDGLIDRVEVKAEKDPDFKKVIMGVWKSDMADDVWNRVKVLQSA